MEELTNRFLEAAPFVTGVVVAYMVFRSICGKARTDEWGRESEPTSRRLEIAREVLWLALATILLYELLAWGLSMM
jgi:hypothetical protein